MCEVNEVKAVSAVLVPLALGEHVVYKVLIMLKVGNVGVIPVVLKKYVAVVFECTFVKYLNIVLFEVIFTQESIAKSVCWYDCTTSTALVCQTK